MKFPKRGETSPNEMHPEGTWKARVVGSDLQETKTGRPMIVLNLKTSKGKLRHYITWVEEYPGLFMDPMYGYGLDDDFFGAEPELEEVATELLKREALVEVVHADNGKGGLWVRIDSVNPIPDNGIKEPAPRPVPQDDDEEPPF